MMTFNNLHVSSVDTVVRYLWLFVLVGLLVFVRSYNVFMYPFLPYEDGTFMFAYYINHPEPSAILRFYGGYISLLPNMIGYFATRISITLAPYIMVTIALFVTTYSMTLFALPHYRFALDNDWGRITACLGIALLPLGNFALYSSTTYSQWHFLWIFLMLIFSPAPTSTALRICWFIFLGLAAWSHPLSIVGIPLLFLLFFIRHETGVRLMYIGLIALIIAYQILGVQVNNAPGMTIQSVWVTIRYILHRVLFESLFGDRLRVYLHKQQLDWVINGVAFITIGVTSLLLWMSRKRLPLSSPLFIGGLLLIIGGVSIGSVVGRSMDNNSHLGPLEQRYFYLQQMAFVLILFMAVFYALQSRTWTYLTRSIGVLVGLAIGVGLVWSNQANSEWFYRPKEIGQNVQAFVKAVDRKFTHGCDSANGSTMVFDRGGYWDIRINLPCSK